MEDILLMSGRVRIRPPVHPGRILYDLWMAPCGTTAEELADNLDDAFTAKEIQAVINGDAPISWELACNLSDIYNTSVVVWTKSQERYDNWHKNNTKR